MDATLQFDKEALERLCRRHHVRRLDLFGSRAKGMENARSDVDLLVEYEQGHVPGLLGLLSFEEDLSAIFDGRKIDLVSKGGLSPYLREEILSTRSPLYER